MGKNGLQSALTAGTVQYILETLRPIEQDREKLCIISVLHRDVVINEKYIALIIIGLRSYSELLSAYERPGKYGGSLENRTRLLRESMAGAIKVCGGDFIVSSRMNVELDWHGHGSRIRLNLPTTFHGRDVYHEVPFGVTRRESYRNRHTAKGEWPVQRFAAMVDGRRGIALINRGVAGVEQEGSTLSTTLIRAFGPHADYRVPATDLACQKGISAFEFMIMPYEGRYLDANVLRTAQAYNQPLQAYEGESTAAKKDVSFLSVDSDTVLLSAVKQPWDGAQECVIRLYESAGKRQDCTVIIAGLQEAYASDIQETRGEKLNIQGQALQLQFAPFEIKTIRVKR